MQEILVYRPQDIDHLAAVLVEVVQHAEGLRAPRFTTIIIKHVRTACGHWTLVISPYACTCSITNRILIDLSRLLRDRLAADRQVSDNHCTVLTANGRSKQYAMVIGWMATPEYSIDLLRTSTV